MTFKKTFFTLLAALVISVPSLVFGEVVLIVHPDNPNSSISKSDCARLFLGRTKKFPDGSAAVAFNLAADTAPRVEFDQQYLDKSPSQIKAFWSNQLFTGKGVPPEELADSAAAIARVSSDSSAIAYIDASAANGSVKVISVE